MIHLGLVSPPLPVVSVDAHVPRPNFIVNLRHCEVRLHSRRCKRTRHHRQAWELQREMKSGNRVASPQLSATASVPSVDMLRFSCMVRNASLLQSQPSCRQSRTPFGSPSLPNDAFASPARNRDTHCNQSYQPSHYLAFFTHDHPG